MIPNANDRLLSGSSPGVCVGPWAAESLVEIVQGAGGRVVDLDEADALVWVQDAPEEFPKRLDRRVRWVHLPSAGIENWLASGVIDRNRVWTSAVGVHGSAVAEHALMLLLAGLHVLPVHLAASSWREGDRWNEVGSLRGSVVGVVGGGGIGGALMPLLKACGAEVVFVTRSGRPIPGALQVLSFEHIEEFWSTVDHVILAAPATAETRKLVGVRELRQLGPAGWLVNVARGCLVDTDALVRVLATGGLGGAALDVTDPEPLPDGHELWSDSRVIITPHIANPQGAFGPAFAKRLQENLKRFIEGNELLGTVELEKGY